MASTEQLLLAGYIRAIEEVLSKSRKGFNIIIPLNINQICYEFYVIPLFIYIHNDNNFHALDVTSIQTAHINLNFINSFTNQTVLEWRIPPFTYIPNIFQSSSIKQLLPIKVNDNIIYDAIFSKKVNWSRQSFMNVAHFDIFPVNNCNKCNEQSYSLTSTEPLVHGQWSFIFCGKHGIFGLNALEFYQLKLNDIQDDNFEFRKLGSQPCDKWSIGFPFLGLKSLSMHYITKTESIFGIESFNSWIRKNKSLNESNVYSKRCGIFDLNTLEWKDIAQYKHNGYKWSKYKFKSGICSIYDLNKLYLLTSIGYLSQYDFGNNKWYHLCQDIDDQHMIFYDTPIIWNYPHSPNILYCIGSKNKKKTNVTCRYFDIRDNDKKWRKCMEHIEQQFVTQFCGGVFLFMQ